MSHESYFQLNDETYFLIHNELRNRPTLIFLHGIGDSHIDYLPYLSTDLATHFNILIPDLLGHGNSSSANNYSFNHQVEGILGHIAHVQKTHNIQLNNITLIAHSMAGIHATLLCESPLQKNIIKLINVEGSITQYGSFIAGNMIQSLETESFDKWFDDFKKKIYEISNDNHFIRPYYASLNLCQPNAFKQNAIEMYQMCHALSGKYTHMIGKKYTGLNLPKIYCYGDSMCNETLAFLKENHLKTKHFPAKTHFVLSECVDEFVKFVIRVKSGQVTT